MAFFPRNFYQTSDSSFTPLFRLLDDFDNYSRQGGGQGSSQHGRRNGSLPSWQPKFDVRETGDSYELHGELPGMTKDQVHVEFTDPQTMLVRGRVERNYTAGTPPTAGHLEDGSQQHAGAITEGSGEEHRSRSPHRATVEDEGAEDGNAGTAVAESKTDTQHHQQHNKKADTAKYWLTERSVGEFARSFNFPSRIDQDGVSAGFKDGILSIVVPKAKKHESRRIAIN